YWDGVTFVPQANLGTLFLGGTLNGYAVGQGGALTIKTGYDVVIAASLPQEDTGPTYRLFTPDFFTHGGFSSYTVVGERSVTVAPGTVLAPSTETLSFGGPISADGSTSLSGGDLQLSTGTRLDDVLGRQILPEVYQRKPMSLTLTTLPVATSAAGGQTSDLSLGIGAKIDLSAYPGSTVNLSAYDKVDIYGTVLAPGGSIGLTVSGMSGQGSVVLESGAELAAYGYQTATLVTHDELVRSVAPGGTISISSSGAVEIDPARSGAGGAPAAVIDVSGFAHGWADLQGGPSSAYYVATPVDGSAGSLTISAESGVVAGNLKLGPGGSSGVGGALTINRIPGAGGAVPMVVTQSASGASAGSQNLTVVADSVNASGADDLTLQTIAPGAAVNSLAYSDAILFSGNVNLQTRNSITLVAPILAAEPGGSGPAPSAVTISSHYVDLQGESVTSSLGTVSLPAAGQGTGLGSTFTIKADLIDIARTMVLGCYSADCTFGGFSTASFVSSGDVRLSDRDLAGSSSEFPGLFSAGSLEFKSAQVYVTARQESGSDLERGGDDPGFWVYSGDRISIIGNGNPAPVPQSFGERLTLEAPVIDQGGVLRAPQGQIFLTGTGPTGSVTLEAGSVTSAALGGVSVAFGPVETGGVFYGYDQAGLVPTKSVNLSGVNIAVNKGAVIDVSGGGDLQGYLFTSGNGGTQDVLSSSNGFAVVPSIGASPLPVSPVSSLSDPRLAVGDTVWLQGVPGLPDGTYTLLPSHYALLPGGYLVVPLGGAFAAPPPTTYRPDGSVVVSGYETRSGNPGYGQFVVMSQQVFDQYSQFTNYSFNQFAANLASQESAVVRTPNDAGTVVLSASQSLSLLGTGRLGGSGLLGDLDISAPDIAVLASGASAPTDGK
ncbi:MAG TPA: hypothetical protein VMH38_04905, partial [Thermoplasmata archaeon]|nr:hypothetical protein [Thermoplasmata archaeon]